MNAMQFEVAKLEAEQRARLAIGAFMESMTPPQAAPSSGQGVPNASNTQTQNPLDGQQPVSPGPGDVPQGDIRPQPY
jgi:hypothetical protein